MIRIRRAFVPVSLSVTLGICLAYRKYDLLVLLAGAILILLCTTCINHSLDILYEFKCTPKQAAMSRPSFGVHFFIPLSKSGKALFPILIFLSFAVFAWCSARMEQASFDEQLRLLDRIGTEEVCLTGVVKDVKEEDGVRKITLTEVQIESDAAKDQREIGTQNGAEVLWDGIVRTERSYPELLPGDLVEMKGGIRPFSMPTNPGMFPSRDYQRARGISWSMSEPSDLRSPGTISRKTPLALSLFVRRKLLSLKEWLGAGIDRVAPDDCRGIFHTLILGQKEELEDDLYELYTKNGIGHILAVSGLHLGIVGLGLYHLLRKIPMRGSFAFSGILSLLSLGLYVEMTGSTVSGRRALLMMCMVLVAEGLGRKSDGLNSLCFAVTVILIREPRMLFESAFLFSVLSVGAVHTLAPLLKEWVTFTDRRKDQQKILSELFGLKSSLRRMAENYCPNILINHVPGESSGLIEGENLLVGIGIAWVNLPINALFYYSYPLHGILLNTLVLPLLPLVWYLGAAAAFLGAVNLRLTTVLGRIILFPASGLLELMSYLLSKLNAVGSSDSFFGLLQSGLSLPVYRTGCPHPWQLWLYVWISLTFFCLLHLILTERRRREILRRIGTNPYGMVEEEDIQKIVETGQGKLEMSQRKAEINQSKAAIYQSKAEEPQRIVGDKTKVSKLFYLLKKPLFRIGFLLVIFPCVLILKRPRESGFRVTFLDVGQGNCTVLEFPDGRVGVADCGSTSVSMVGRYRLMPYLAYYGHGEMIDEVWLSHFDEDHINGIRDALEQGVKIGRLNLASDPESKAEMKEICDLVRSRGGEIAFWNVGTKEELSGVKVICLWPEGEEDGNGNDDSEVLLFEYEGRRILLTGDITTAGAELRLMELLREPLPIQDNRVAKGEMIQKNSRITHWENLGMESPNTGKTSFDDVSETELPVTVLQIPHHGSKYSCSEEFISFLSPEIAVCSVGTNNYGHPHPDVLKRLEQAGLELYRTDLDGAVMVRVKDGEVLLERYCDGTE